ncbi:MAG: Coenzyme F420 hydrogenase/dehydrogenase, beta subunit C-terminal domain [Clostridia bacterium]|nr:Coenzyme F420 hydrogenase/dehydrogenase, beta subunit C-terminal domain [Clostridia bacterium]
MKKIVLYSDKKDCCGCGACMNACPQSAIKMCEDEHGFVYPVIVDDLCIGCGACEKACVYQNSPDVHPPLHAYAAAARDNGVITKSASGGAFAVIADKVLSGGGVVYGCALVFEDSHLEPRHIRIDSVEDIPMLQGSKYVQSEIGGTYKKAKQDLTEGKSVLFTGTPCQIAGLKQYLKKEYDKLLTVEIICHGVPGKRLFQEFLEYYGEKLGGKITAFYFRDKSKGQGMVSRCVYQDPAGSKKESIKNGNLLAYIFFFLKSYTYRINCYSCPFARPERVADITLGDYWGFHEEYPQYHESQGLSNGRGISCVLVNSEKGKQMWDTCQDQLISMPSEFEKIARHNDQLRKPSKYDQKRETILHIFDTEGYAGVERFFKAHFKKDIAKQTLASMVPKDLKRRVKKLIGRLYQWKRS